MEDFEEEYIDFLRDKQMRDLSLITELPEDYNIDYHAKLETHVEKSNQQPTL